MLAVSQSVKHSRDVATPNKFTMFLDSIASCFQIAPNGGVVEHRGSRPSQTSRRLTTRKRSQLPSPANVNLSLILKVLLSSVMEDPTCNRPRIFFFVATHLDPKSKHHMHQPRLEGGPKLMRLQSDPNDPEWAQDLCRFPSPFYVS